MENTNIILLKHSPMDVYFTNKCYTNQTSDNLSDYEIIDVTSHIIRKKEFMSQHPNFAKEISPFYMGPVETSDGTIANNFEIMWQCSKVYPPHDDNGKPNEEYFKWRNYYYSLEQVDKKTMRHACQTIGCEHRDTLYSAYYDKERKEYVALDYIEARKKVYFPEYAKLFYSTDSYKFLESIVKSGKKLALVDFDGYNYYDEMAMQKRYESYVTKCKKDKVIPTLTESDFTNIHSMKDVINTSFLNAGHGFVIKALLQGDLEVKDGIVIDHAGILE